MWDLEEFEILKNLPSWTEKEEEFKGEFEDDEFKGEFADETFRGEFKEEFE